MFQLECEQNNSPYIYDQYYLEVGNQAMLIEGYKYIRNNITNEISGLKFNEDGSCDFSYNYCDFRSIPFVKILNLTK